MNKYSKCIIEEVEKRKSATISEASYNEAIRQLKSLKTKISFLDSSTNSGRIKGLGVLCLEASRIEREYLSRIADYIVEFEESEPYQKALQEYEESEFESKIDDVYQQFAETKIQKQIDDIESVVLSFYAEKSYLEEKQAFLMGIKKGLANSDNTKEIILSEYLLKLLKEQSFIEDKDANPLKWIKTNGKTHGKVINKKSLIDLLCLLEYPDNIITNIALLNKHFIFSNGKPLSSNNITPITNKTGKLIRPVISEYHTELENIVKKSKILTV